MPVRITLANVKGVAAKIEEGRCVARASTSSASNLTTSRTPLSPAPRAGERTLLPAFAGAAAVAGASAVLGP